MTAKRVRQIARQEDGRYCYSRVCEILPQAQFEPHNNCVIRMTGDYDSGRITNTLYAGTARSDTMNVYYVWINTLFRDYQLKCIQIQRMILYTPRVTTNPESRRILTPWDKLAMCFMGKGRIALLLQPRTPIIMLRQAI